MAIEPLTNDRWGFESNCFVCEQSNERGLQVPFHHDTERDVVVAELRLADHFSGAELGARRPRDGGAGRGHGVGRHRGAAQVGCYQETQAWFDRPVLVDKGYRVEARVVQGDDSRLETEASVVSVDTGKVSVRARAMMSVVTDVQAPALGLSLEGDGRDYVTGAQPDD